MGRISTALAVVAFAHAFLLAPEWAHGGGQHPKPPYPPSGVIQGITWHWDTHATAAPGSDLWPVTWGADGNLYAAWGDGGGFGGTNSDGRVSMGFARIEGPPGSYVGVNVNGGKNSEHPASFPRKGKTGGMIAVRGTLYAWLNLQDGTWPGVNQSLAWSTDRGATWTRAPWVFPKGAGNFKPARFLNSTRGHRGVPERLTGFVYFYRFSVYGDGARQGINGHDRSNLVKATLTHKRRGAHDLRR